MKVRLQFMLHLVTTLKYFRELSILHFSVVRNIKTCYYCIQTKGGSQYQCYYERTDEKTPTWNCFDEGEKDSGRKDLVMARGARPQAKPGWGQRISAEVTEYS